MAWARAIKRVVIVAAALAAVAVPASAQAQSGSPLVGDGMWIWYVSRSGGSAEAIAAQAKSYGIEHVLVKSGDGTNPWSQFTPQLVATLRAAGIRVCGWQFVYGRSPATEASVGAQAAAAGADCLVIDAESHFEGRYSAADKYMSTLRALVGTSYPLALSSFPYVHYHPSFPYSVFLRRGGAQFNVPQMYWKTIGTSVKTVFERTYSVNRPYKRPIFPLGQTYSDPPLSDISAFKRYAAAAGAGGVSWWSWQETSTPEWVALSAPVATAAGYGTRTRWPRLRRGSRGDLVVQAQQLLSGARVKTKVTGIYSKRTVKAVRKFQGRARLPRRGVVNKATWKRLLAFEPKPVRWSVRKRSGAATSSSGGREPLSAKLPAKEYEIPPNAGSG